MINNIYNCKINGEYYGTGRLDYMRELFNDYIDSNMYDRNSVSFEIYRKSEE